MAQVSAPLPHLTTIKLSGSLARTFGRTHQRQIDSGATFEAIKALKVTIMGFEKEIRRLDSLGVRFAIFRNGKNVGLDEFERNGTREIRIVPVVEGSKRAGSLQVILGAVLILASTLVSGGTATTLVASGIATIAGGVIQMLSPQATGLSTSGAPANLPSYAFGSARNTTASGYPVPICIGQRRWGGSIISASIEAQDKTQPSGG